MVVGARVVDEVVVPELQPVIARMDTNRIIDTRNTFFMFPSKID